MASDLKVILFSANSVMSNRRRMQLGPNSLALKTIESGLKARGFNSVDLFPSSGEYCFNDFQGNPGFKARLDGSVKSAGRVVFGISTTTPDYPRFKVLSQFLKGNYPDAVIVAGGPHFVRENLVDSAHNSFRDPVEIALTENLADAVVVGHAKPFIDWIVENQGKLAEGLDRNGLYYLDSGKVLGAGLGRFPRLNAIPYILSHDERTADILVSDTCANECGFCSVNRGRLGFSREVIEKSLRELFNLKRLSFVRFIDSNPFEPKPGLLLRALDAIEPEPFPSIFKFGFLDPSLIADSGAFDLAIRLNAHGFVDFFIGRDVVCEDDAKIVGAKYKGKIKTQKQIDDEYAALKLFIEAQAKMRKLSGEVLKGGRFYPPSPINIVIAYLLHPFMTLRETGRIMAEMRQFEGLSGEHVGVEPSIAMVSPYSGTEIRRAYIDYILEPENFAGFSEDRVWNPSMFNSDQIGSFNTK